MSLSNLSL